MSIISLGMAIAGPEAGLIVGGAEVNQMQFCLNCLVLLALGGLGG